MKTDQRRNKPSLIVVSASFKPNSGSEPGKGFNWARSLARLYDVHLVAPGNVVALYKDHPECGNITFHPAKDRFQRTTAAGLGYYTSYYKWCQSLVPLLRDLVVEVNPCGLHHITLGSFRFLPPYDLLGIPYTLGPIGGGESIPLKFIFQAGFPWKDVFWETVRHPINCIFTCIPPLRRVFQKARLSIATTRETEYILKKFGAQNTGIVFPDVAERIIPEERVRKIRLSQLHEFGSTVRLVWSARFLWWKGGQLAVEFMNRLRCQGIDAKLEIFSEGQGIKRLKEEVNRHHLEKHIFFHGFVPREELLLAFCRNHLFIYPTMHDSSSSAIIEAYMVGLPSMTLGMGGPAEITSAETGLNLKPDSMGKWMRDGISMIEEWLQSPEVWYRAVEASLEKFRSFLPDQLDLTVERILGPESGVYIVQGQKEVKNK